RSAPRQAGSKDRQIATSVTSARSEARRRRPPSSLVHPTGRADSAPAAARTTLRPCRQPAAAYKAGEPPDCGLAPRLPPKSQSQRPPNDDDVSARLAASRAPPEIVS